MTVSQLMNRLRDMLAEGEIFDYTEITLEVSSMFRVGKAEDVQVEGAAVVIYG